MICDFVRREGQRLIEGNCDYKIAGANCYYLAYVEEPVQSAVLDLAASLSLNVVRIWAFWEDLPQNSIFFERLDRAISMAAERGLRLILTLANNWKDFGGIPEYLDRFGLSGHDQFYRDGRCRAAYWIRAEQLIDRVNTLTGKPYNEDPIILAWELANEPRCPDAKDGEQLLISWIWEMASLVRSKAPRQLIAAGDEGFFRRSGARKNDLFNGSQGTNFEAILGVTPVDFGTYHMYGEWAKKEDLPDWGLMWIREHIEAAERANKPVLLEEYGAAAIPNRAQVYDTWLREIERSDALGDLLWMLGLPKGPGQPYDPDSYVISSGSEIGVIRAHARRLLGLN
jgi:mannan endo-1,4-beta-mannosidase